MAQDAVRDDWTMYDPENEVIWSEAFDSTVYEWVATPAVWWTPGGYKTTTSHDYPGRRSV